MINNPVSFIGQSVLGGTSGSVLFVNSTGSLSQDNANFSYSSGNLVASTSVQTLTVRGGTASGGDLTLSSTSNATKGDIIFGSSYYDEVNNFLGLGMSGATSPSRLTVGISSNATGIFTNVNQEGMRYLNRDSTVNNWEELLFGNAGTGNSAGIAVQNNSHVTQSGTMILATGQSGTLTEVVRLDNTGNTILTNGGSSNTLPFQVAAQENFRLTTRNSTVNNWSEIMFKGTGANAFNAGIAVQNVSHSVRAGNMAFFAGNGTSLIEVLRLHGATSNVSIGGIASPTARLHLPAGTAAASTAPLKFNSGTNLTTAEAGAVEYDGNKFYVTPKSQRRVVTDADGSITSDTTVANTVTETTLYTETIPANELYQGQMITVQLFGLYSSANGADTCTLRFKIGSTTIISVVTPANLVTNAPISAEYTFTVRSTGATGTVISYGEVYLDNTGASSASTATTTVDTTTSNNLVVTAQWSNALAGNTVTAQQAVTKFII